MSKKKFDEIAQRLDLLEEGLNKNIKRMQSLNARQLETRKSAEVAIERIGQFQPSEVEGFLVEAKKDAQSVRDKYRAMLLRITVATELAYVARGVSQLGERAVAAWLIRAFDNSDDWWLSRENMEIRDWMNELLRNSEAA